MKALYIVLTLAALAACLAAPVLFFLGNTDATTYKNVFLAATLVYFVFATWWAGVKEKAAA